MTEMNIVALNDGEEMTYYLLTENQWDYVFEQKVDTYQSINALLKRKDKPHYFVTVMGLIQYIQEHNITIVAELQEMSF